MHDEPCILGDDIRACEFDSGAMTVSGWQMAALLKTLEDGNRAHRGLGKARMSFGIAGASLIIKC